MTSPDAHGKGLSGGSLTLGVSSVAPAYTLTATLGLLVAAVGVAPALGAAGAAYLVSTTVPGLRPEWREMDRSRAQPGVGRE